MTDGYVHEAPTQSRRSYTYLLIVLLTTFTSFTHTYSKNLSILNSALLI